MSWFKLLRADNVKIDANDRTAGFYDPETEETTINLARALDIQDIITYDTHEELHKQTVADIEAEMFEYISMALHNVLRKEHYSARGNKVMFKGMSIVTDTISDKVAGSVTFHEILAHTMTFSPTIKRTQEAYAEMFDDEIDHVWDNIVLVIIEEYAKRATGLEDAMLMNHAASLGQEFKRVVRDKANEAFKKYTDKDTDWMKSLQSHNIGRPNEEMWEDA